MSHIEAKSKSQTTEVDRDLGRSSGSVGRPAVRRRRFMSVFITLAAAGLSVWLGRAMWDVYMGAPWTRDGTVRAYVVTMAPEVAGRIVSVPVADNQYVHKGDLLVTIEPTDYAIAVEQTQEATNQAQANAANTEREARRRDQLTDLATSQEEKQTYDASAIAADATSTAAAPIQGR